MDGDRRRAERVPNHERARHWAATRASLDDLTAEVVLRCWQYQLSQTRLRGLTPRYAWMFDITAPGDGPWDSLAHMHIGFISSQEWVLLGYHAGDYRMVVDKLGRLHPGLRQGFIYDGKRREADVILNLSTEQIRNSIMSQIDSLATLAEHPTAPIMHRPRYA